MPLVPLLLSVALAAAAPPAATTLDGRPVDAASLRGSVLLFWRADCAPCLAELADLPQLRQAAGRLRVQPVVLDEAPGRPGPVARCSPRSA